MIAPEKTTSQSNDIYTYCHCAYYDFSEMRSCLQDNTRCVAYNSVLQLEWRSGDVFAFDYGVLVFWGVTAPEREEFINKIDRFARKPLTALIEDEFTFEVAEGKVSIKNDHITLPDLETLTMLAVSHGIAQSTKLGQFEQHVQETITDTVHIPENIARTGKTQLSRRELSQLRGRLFLSKSDIMLNYDLLDVPDFFWEYPELDIYYRIISEYLEISQRVEVLSKKLETIHELFEMMADEQKHKHSSMLEWIIIWLIAFEILVFLVHDVIEMF